MLMRAESQYKSCIIQAQDKLATICHVIRNVERAAIAFCVPGEWQGMQVVSAQGDILSQARPRGG